MEASSSLSPPDHDSNTAPPPPPAAAAAAVSMPQESSSSSSMMAASTPLQQQQQQPEDDARMAVYFHVMEALTMAYGFDSTVAQEALDQVLVADCNNNTASLYKNPDEIVTTAYNYILDHGLAPDQGGPVVPLETCPHCVPSHIQVTPPQLKQFLKLPVESNTCSYPQEIEEEQQQQHKNSSPSSSHRIGLAKPEYDENGACPAGENWLCLSCGVVRCSRYINGHAVEHWQASTTTTSTTTTTLNSTTVSHSGNDNIVNDDDNEDISTVGGDGGSDNDGHAVAVSLADLSVWCYACQAYLRPDHNALLQPLLQTLQQLKFGMEQDDVVIVVDSSAMSTTSETSQPQDDQYDDNLMQQPMEESTHQRYHHNRHQHQHQHEEEAMSCDDYEDGNEEEEENFYQDVDGGGSRGFPLDISNHEKEDDDVDDDDDNHHHDNSSDDDDHHDSSHHQQHQPSLPLPSQRLPPFPFTKCPTSLSELAQFIQSDQCRSIVILAGAGMSVASGIPDFRSSHDGLYATINPHVLSCTNARQRQAIMLDPTFCFSQDLFLENPLPCLELLKTFVINTHAKNVWKATLAHRLVELLAYKQTNNPNKLVRLYTQNIDGLEGQCTQLPRDKVCHVHGTTDRAECAMCDSPMDMTEFCTLVQRQIKDVNTTVTTKTTTIVSEESTTTDTTPTQSPSPPLESSPIVCPTCGHAAMKPAIVLFRSKLPSIFFEWMPVDVAQVDLLLIMGTSLTVSPANSLVWKVPSTTLRVVMNRHKVGQKLGIRYYDNDDDDDNGDDDHDSESDDDDNDNHHHRHHHHRRDYFAQGDCEEVALELLTHLGWLSDLKPLLDDDLLPASSAQLLRDKLNEVAAAATTVATTTIKSSDAV